jgi:hypothetical protein
MNPQFSLFILLENTKRKLSFKFEAPKIKLQLKVSQMRYGWAKGKSWNL